MRDEAGSVELRPVTRDNFEAVIALEVADEQREFLEANVEALAWAHVAEECRPFVIYEGDTPVGFTTYGYIPDDGRCWIIHLMVDRRRQGIGIGRAALNQLLERMSAESGGGRLLVAVNPANATALRMYGRFGFEDTGHRQNGEMILARPGPAA